MARLRKVRLGRVKKFKRKIRCSSCGGDGSVYEWQGNDMLILEDCERCGGKGNRTITVIDRRKISKKKPLFPEEA